MWHYLLLARCLQWMELQKKLWEERPQTGTEEMKIRDMSMITINPSEINQQAQKVKQTKRHKEKSITENIHGLKTMIWQHRSQNQSDGKVRSFFLFFLFIFFPQNNKRPQKRFLLNMQCWSTSTQLCIELGFFFWIHTTSTISHPFTVQFDKFCIDLRAFGEQNLFEFAHPQGISHRDCAAKKVKKNDQSISE